MRSPFQFIDQVDISELESLLLVNGQMVPAPYKEVNRFTQTQIGNFCLSHAIYQIITTELVDFLRSEISQTIPSFFQGGVPEGRGGCIEIGAGNGCLGRALGIPITDNCMQNLPAIKAYYRSCGQPTIKYPADIIQMDANTAVNHYRPEVVIGSWITQKWKPYFSDDIGSNALGPDETLFKGKVKKYILVGSEIVHGDKEILKLFPYKKYQFPWLISRQMKRQYNLIYIFKP